jgi:hypothetical protein
MNHRDAEDDTFDALRRISYWIAGAEYCIATMHLSENATEEQLREAADPVLKTLGWTVDELYAYESNARRDI